jgi:hypothetical protein
LLVVEQGTDPAKRYLLQPTRVTEVGRGEGCDVQLVDARISRVHVRISRAAPEEGWWVEDADSANGTLLDGKPLVGRARWLPGQVVQVADALLRMQSFPEQDLQVAMRNATLSPIDGVEGRPVLTEEAFRRLAGHDRRVLAALGLPQLVAEVEFPDLPQWVRELGPTQAADRVLDLGEQLVAAVRSTDRVGLAAPRLRLALAACPPEALAGLQARLDAIGARQDPPARLVLRAGPPPIDGA